MRRAFTIIELMMVVAIIAVLVTIVAFVARGAIAQAQWNRASAIAKTVQQGIDVYHAQKGEWPLEGLDRKTPNNSAKTRYTLDKEDVRQCMRALLQECKQGNPMFDVSGLFVSRGPLDGPDYDVFASNRDQLPVCYAKYGLDFMSAIHGTRRSGRKMKLDEMWFGYPGEYKYKGKKYNFACIQMEYDFPSDQLVVLDPNPDPSSGSAVNKRDIEWPWM